MSSYLGVVGIFVGAAKGISALQAARYLNTQYRTEFILLHKLRSAMADEKGAFILGGLDAVVEVDGYYTGGKLRKANWKQNRRDARLRRNQNGKRRVVVVARERIGRTITHVILSEADAVDWLVARLRVGTEVHADEAASWNELEGHFETRRIRHEDVFSDGVACTNQAESFFARVRRCERGQHHHIVGPYLHLYAAEMAWREDHRREDTAALFTRLVRLVGMKPPSRDFCGYWQRTLRRPDRSE